MPPSPASLQWLTLVAVIWLQSINATNSDFPAYSSQLKHLLSISQVQLNNLAFASDAGKFFGWISGVSAARLPLWLVLLIGALLGSIGYGIQFLFLANMITSLPYWQIFLLCALAGNSICWINTVCYVATIHNFPLDRQIGVGLSTSYFGLTAKIYTSMNDVIFRGSPNEKAKGYLLLNAAVPMVASIITAPLVRKIKVERPAPMGGGFLAMFFITVATGVYAVIGSVGYFSTHLSSMVHAVGLGALLIAPLAVPAITMFVDGFGGKWASCKRERRVYDLSIDEGSFGGRVVEIDVKEEAGVTDEDGGGKMMTGLGEETGVRKMVKTSEFWLYFFVYMFGGTLGLVFLNNLGQIAESRGLYNTSSLVSLASSFGFFGRLMPSVVDYFLTK
ncbi:hypothetical protein ACLOJK_023204 [Asimina triloba]